MGSVDVSKLDDPGAPLGVIAQPRWLDEHTLGMDVGPCRVILAHVMDGMVYLYRWHDPEGDAVDPPLPYQSESQGRVLVERIFRTYGVRIPPWTP